MATEPEPTFRDPGEVPVLDWIDKALIDVDPAYQRGLDEARVLRILDWFDWRSFGALVVAPADSGRYHAIDGQHRLEAAKRHPKVSLVPAIITSAKGTAAEAETFVSVNGDRKNVSALEMHWAQLAAADPEAVTVAQVAERAGIALLRYPGSNANYKPGETIAIAALRGLVDRRGALKARQILDVLARADLAPITGLQIRAAELLLTDAEYCDEVDADGLAESIRGRALVIEDDAKTFAATHRVTTLKGFASVWFKKTRKRRRAAA